MAVLRRVRTRTLIKVLLAALTVFNLWYFTRYDQDTHDAHLLLQMRRQRFLRNHRYESSSPTKAGIRKADVRLSEEDSRQAAEIFAREGFNYLLSDKLAMDRPLGDMRHPLCRNVTYPADLPTASVIVIFHNEYRSAILRTLHSVINRSPPEYLHEVILVDDGSTKEELGETLDEYVKTTWPDGIVRVLRSPRRQGLIRARLMGADDATGDVIIFLDAHCEATIGWLEPLLARIKEDRTVMVVPVIDVISPDALTYMGGNQDIAIGGFRWDLLFNWARQQEGERTRRKSAVDAIRSPTMPGGLMAAERSYFYELGSYDQKMDTWGGENMELSFRLWMCGGSLDFIPCSRVGHIFRTTHPFKIGAAAERNVLRVARVWMDDYIELFYAHMAKYRNDEEDVADRLALRQRLGCHSFKWYLDNIYPEKYILNDNVQAWGQVRNPASGKCLDRMNGEEMVAKDVGLYGCHSGFVGVAQMFSHTRDGTIRSEINCMKAKVDGSGVYMMPCVGQPAAQTSDLNWLYDEVTKEIRHASLGSCLDARGQMALLQPCDQSTNQQWEFLHP